MALTDTFIKNSTKHTGKPSGDKYPDGAGMYLLVAATGKYWRMNYRFDGKRKTVALGTYPEVPLAKAREHLADGIDPSALKRIEKTARLLVVDNTFKAIVLEWFDSRAGGWSASHAKNRGLDGKNTFHSRVIVN